jgi:dipeptidyl aminopeptidase/acylaminoacyl peptidase
MTGKRKNMTRHRGSEVNAPGPWSADGEGFYLISDKDREFTGLCYVSVQTGKREWLVSDHSDVEDVALSPNGHTLAWAENRQGYSYIHITDAKRKKELREPIETEGALVPGALDNITLLKFSPDGRRLGCIISKAWQPPEIFAFDIPGTSSSRLTDGFVGNVPLKDMVRPRPIAYQSFDRKIPAFLYKPRVASKKRVPVVLMIHGGPQAQERPWYAYAGMYQYLLSCGIGILAPNVRGSTGYGKSYAKLILHDWGGGELKDIEYAWRYLCSLDWVDPMRIAVAGGSFGGFATLSAVTRIPKAWKVGVDIFGPSNLVTFAKAVPEHWMAEWLGDPDKEKDFLLERSPITYVDDVRVPMLIIQGANDPRVVKNESDQFVDKLKSLGREVDYMVLADEGHGFTKQKNEAEAYRRITEFLTGQLHP